MIILPDLGVTLEPTDHIYTLPDGSHPPSVTHITRFISNELYRGTPQHQMDQAADRGRRVHKHTEDFDRYGYCEPEEDAAPYIEGFYAFLRDYKPVWLAREWSAYHKSLLFCGTMDWMGFVRPDDGTGLDLVDIKTTYAADVRPIAAQVSGYVEILKSWGIKVRKRYGLYLLPDGRYLFPELPDAQLAFINCLSLHNYMAA